ncbi:HWE histidine kinase domain-containing protein [Microvirga sp. GCM10011540]|uniref:HWE histidine kinase domain-containing protein n=1 Tax=Microvirga sp. GCM10011540 TaxID=3317338 RepID=UPI00360FE807
MCDQEGHELFQQAFTERIASLGKTHSLLTEVRWRALTLRELVCPELEPYDHAGGKRNQILRATG